MGSVRLALPLFLIGILAAASPLHLSNATPLRIVPTEPESTAFAGLTATELSVLLRLRKVTSLRLTRITLDRLRGPSPRGMVTHVLTEELALAQAARADRELAAGKLRSPLHGIPYGIENILATRGIRAPKTTAANDGQIPPGDVTVVRKLEESGAVLVAWLTPGKAVQAVADGSVPFAITSDGWGLPDSLLARGRVAALLPPKGVVSRAGCTALGWSTGRIGPVCRSAAECAIVLRAIAGPDGIDPSLPRDPPHLPTRTVPKPDAE